MATFKHISSKNADYGAAEQYLTFEHDEFTMRPTLDETGRLVPREEYRISSLNCGGEDFAVACMRSNLRYGKNQKREDVKSHHYIISFDPRDGTDNGLTVDRAQQLGEGFCKAHFPGHQALICTHPDGHNHSGNIHVHIVINSLRIEEVPLLPYMDRPADTRAGCKHRCTDAAMEYFKAEVMEMCHRENLYQIDLLHGSKNRVTEREYWAQRKGQARLDKQAAEKAAAGEPVKPTKFETDKERLRQTTVRTLHYYDEIGLLPPSEVTSSGYRVYNDADLEVLQQILFFRELDFSLEEIRGIMQNPAYEKETALQNQKALLVQKRDRLDRLIALVDKTLKGERDMSFKQFDTTKIEEAKQQYAAEVKQRWGNTVAYAEYEKKSASYNTVQQKMLDGEGAAILNEFGKNRSLPPDSVEVQELVKKWQAYITDNYYNCTKEILSCLGQMYVGDERFTQHIDQYGVGTAAFMAAAIEVYTS